jgi:hypothetical protein
MDPALIPLTAPGRQLAWLMNLQTEPSSAEIQDHLEPTAPGEVHVFLPGRATDNPGVPPEMVRLAALARPAGSFVVSGRTPRSRRDLPPLALIAHEVGPGFTSPGIGAVEYGYWELKAPSADVPGRGPAVC